VSSIYPLIERRRRIDRAKKIILESNGKGVGEVIAKISILLGITERKAQEYFRIICQDTGVRVVNGIIHVKGRE